MPTEIFKDRSYAQGNFDVGIEAGQIGSGDFRFTLSVVGTRDPSQQEQVQGKISALYQQYNRLPVDQVMVRGVNVKDGGLTAQSQALNVAGRGPALHFQQTYSSAVNGQISSMGINWTHNFDSSIHINKCGEVMVSAGDGGSVRFFPRNDGKLVANLGYRQTQFTRSRK